MSTHSHSFIHVEDVRDSVRSSLIGLMVSGKPTASTWQYLTLLLTMNGMSRCSHDLRSEDNVRI